LPRRGIDTDILIHEGLLIKKGEKEMKRTKKLISICIAGIMLTMSLMACQSGDGGKTAKSKEEVNTAEKATEGETKEEEADGNNKEPITYKIATVRWTDAWPVDFLNEGALAALEEKHNVKIEWQVYYFSDWAEQKSLLLASGDLPDAFFGSRCMDETDIVQNQSYFMELTDLIGDNMPNLTQIFKDDPTMLAISRNREGKIYSLPKRLAFRPKVCGDSLYINKEWMDNLGLNMPNTHEDLTDILRAFRDKDADGDGDLNNEIGYSNAASLAGDLRNLLAPFGTLVSRAGNYMGLNKKSEPVFMPIQDNYKEAVKWAHELYSEGLLDQERFTQDFSMVTAKTKAEGGAKVGIVYGWTADAQVGVNADQFELVEALAGPDGERYVESDPSYLDMASRELVITNMCEQPERLLQWADDFYTDLMSLQMSYGSIPDQIKDNGDGTYEVLVPADGSSLDTSAWSHSPRDFGPKYMNRDFYDKVTLPEDQGDGVKLAEDAVNGKHVKKTAFPVVSYTADQLVTMNNITTDIYKYVEVQYAHWVVDGGIEEEWDDYISQLEAMGLKELLDIHADAYQAYLDVLK